MSSYSRMMKKPMRSRIKAYRASGRMFAQTFNTGLSSPPIAQASREWLNAYRLLREWIANRNSHPDRQYVRECIREQIALVRELKAAIPE